MTMKDWIKELDNHLLGNKRPLLDNKGKISHKQAMAEKEFDIYRKQEMKNLVSDFDKAIKKSKIRIRKFPDRDLNRINSLRERSHLSCRFRHCRFVVSCCRVVRNLKILC